MSPEAVHLDPVDRVILAALQRGVAIGAHPGYPDRAGFGRVAMALSPKEVEACVAEQVERLSAIARQEGTRVRHVKPHGALYHAAMNDREIAAADAHEVVAGCPSQFEAAFVSAAHSPDDVGQTIDACRKALRSALTLG